MSGEIPPVVDKAANPHNMRIRIASSINRPSLRLTEWTPFLPHRIPFIHPTIPRKGCLLLRCSTPRSSRTIHSAIVFRITRNGEVALHYCVINPASLPLSNHYFDELWRAINEVLDSLLSQVKILRWNNVDVNWWKLELRSSSGNPFHLILIYSTREKTSAQRGFNLILMLK